jgi:hypothetical protein
MKTLVYRLDPAAWARAVIALFAALLVVTTVSPAAAAGRVVWKSTTVQERTKNESWRLEMEIHLPRAPDIAHKSMKFEFTQTAEFERSLVDGQEGPQTRTVPLTNQQSIIESQTVGFLDPGTGQTQARTRFSFKVTRAHGYKAGTWKVKIKDGDTGQMIGSETTLKMEGENPVVDRRSIVFQGNKKKDEEKKGESSDSGSGSDESAPTDPADAPPEEEPYEGEPDGEGQVPPSIEEKPGGGCHYAPRPTEPLWFLLGLGIGASLLLRRRS